MFFQLIILRIISTLDKEKIFDGPLVYVFTRLYCNYLRQGCQTGPASFFMNWPLIWAGNSNLAH